MFSMKLRDIEREAPELERISRCQIGRNELIALADQALYQAKNSGRNQVRVRDYLSN